MSDNGATSFPTQLADACSICGDCNDVTWFCKSCAEWLCNTCKISHPTILMFKNHIIRRQTNYLIQPNGPSKIVEQCRFHTEKEISTYCIDCQVPCCATCLVDSHQQHKFTTKEDMYLSAENMLNGRLNELEKDVIPTLDKMTDKLMEDKYDKSVRIASVTKEINTFRMELKQAVEDSCDDLIEKLDQNNIEFDYLIARIEVKKRKVRKLVNEINEIIYKSDFSMIRYPSLSPDNLISDLPRLKVKIPVFTPGRDILTTIKEKIGTVQWTDINTKSDNSQCLKATFDPSMIHINKVAAFKSKIGVSSIAIVCDNTAWVVYGGSDTMYLYDSSGKVVRSITVKGCEGINDMVIKRSGMVFVTCRDRTIKSVSVKGEVSSLIDTSPFVPYGICLTDRENDVVCMGDLDERVHVAVYSHDTSRKLYEIRGIDGRGKQLFTEPYRVVYNRRDICVVNWRPYNVVCVDERGDVSWVYDGKESNLSESFIPSGISVDQYNNLLVADFNNNCVHYIDRDGRFIQIILTKDQTGLSQHWGICVDDGTGQIWAGSGKKDVVICKYLL